MNNYNKIKLKLITFTLMSLLPLSAFAEYSYYFKVPELSNASFIDKDNGTEEPIPPEEENTCPESFSTPIIMAGYPIISQIDTSTILYEIMYKTDGGFVTPADYANKSTRYQKMILTEVFLNNGGSYSTVNSAQESAYFVAEPDRDLHLKIQSAFWDTTTETFCSYGPSTLLINKTYDELK